MEPVVHLALFLFAAATSLAAVVFIVVDAMGRVDLIRQRAPWIDKILKHREAMVGLTILAICVSVGDGYELYQKELPELPPTLKVEISPPPAPNIVIINPPTTSGRPVRTATTPAPQLNQKGTTAQPMPQPQTPYVTVPIPSISPQQELRNAVDAANSIGQLWTSDLGTAQSSRSALGYLGNYSPKERENILKAAEQKNKELVIRADERVIERWHDVAKAVRKAHSNAVARMSQPGPLQWTRNQISKDKAEFDGLLAPLERRTEDSDNPDKHKFEPLLDYLRKLQTLLDDYQEQ